MQKYIAEFIGTCFLAGIVVLVSSTVIGASGYGIFVAAFVLGFIVYTLGPISGAHVNPALTVGQFSTRKIDGISALWYIIAQAVAGLLVFALAYSADTARPAAQAITDVWTPFFAELVGTFIFAFGVASVVFGKVDRAASGLVVGGALLVGSLVAQIMGSQGILNPAVAYAANLLSASWQGVVVYVVGPLVGAKLAMGLYGFLTKDVTIATYRSFFPSKKVVSSENAAQ